MPAALSSQNDYYARHHRRQSSMSQTSLPDQLRSAAAIPYSPSQSAVFLPATTYGFSAPERASSPSLPIMSNAGLSTQSENRVESIHIAVDPDEFYRSYQPHFATDDAGLRQGILDTQRHDLNQSPGLISEALAGVNSAQKHDQVSTSHIPLPTSRQRKSSVKNLIAQINASSNEEPPPLPINLTSRPVSRNVSPLMPAGPQFGPLNVRKASTSTDPDSVRLQMELNRSKPLPQYGLGLTNDASLFGDGLTYRRPLFGEVFPDAQPSQIPGFGIQQTKLRRGSEGSPVIGISPQFPPITINGDHQVHGSDRMQDEDQSKSETPKPTRRRRVTSETPKNRPSELDLDYLGPSVFTPASDTRGRQKTPLSRIPVSSGRGSASSSSGPRSVTPNSSSSESRLPIPATTPRRASPRPRQRSPPEILSPGRRGKPDSTTSGAKSPSLRANIIVPPPKVSPPLRSSRPRLPVSAASTIASRARMAEKFNEMQKLNNEKRATSARPVRPPELTDVDLKARRLRITQALSRSLEGPDLKGSADPSVQRAASSSRTVSPAASERSNHFEPNSPHDGVPVIVTEQSTASESERDEFETPPEERESKLPANFTHSALQAMQGASLREKREDDSPTLGRGESNLSSRPSPLETNFLRADLVSEHEPSSAATEATIIDPEPQLDVFEPQTPSGSILDHIGRMRQQSPASLHPLSASREDVSDRADVESVHLVLRDTAYLDHSEAIRAGYIQPSAAADPVPQVPSQNPPDRDSWTSSIEDDEAHDDRAISRLDSSSTAVGNEDSIQGQASAVSTAGHAIDQDGSVRSTMASDAYTIVNIVLQQHSTSGVVDQDFVDDVYNRVLQTSPYDTRGSLRTSQIEQLCLREIQSRENDWRKSIIGLRLPSQSSSDATPIASIKESHVAVTPEPRERLRLHPELSPNGLLPVPALKHHHYKSSLDSVEDWANTSPSIGDWMRFAVTDPGRTSTIGAEVLPLKTHEALQSSLKFEYVPDTPTGAMAPILAKEIEEADMYGGSEGDTFTQIPPAPPAKDTPLLNQTAFATPLADPPQVPQRLTSLMQPARQPSLSESNTGGAGAGTAPKASSEDVDREQRQFKKRRHIIKELVDTEFSYEKDLKVMCDIYKQTAPAALTDDDIRVLFGNVEQVQEFSRIFLLSLKSAAKPSYVMQWPDREKDKQPDPQSMRPESTSSSLVNDNEPPTAEGDRETTIGKAFESSLIGMERVYADYIRNRHAANQRLVYVQKSAAAREWLKECKDNSSDITNAWNLDALLVKPVQRITKYPLLLRELSEATPKDHPDAPVIQRALHEVTEINIRINDVKKHAELVDQVLNRKRKDSDVRIGLSKAFGRRAEKLKQHLGTAEMFEDHDYNEIKINYDNNIVQLMVVNNDCSSYGRAVTRWVNKMVEIAAAGESWVDVGSSNHQEAESKLRHFAMVTRGICTIALPDHLEQLEAKVLVPMQTGVDLMNRLKNDPKGLLQKRDKRLIDYAQARNKKDKGEKIDKKMAERMEQWEALNTEAKQRMKKLIRATARLVQACQNNLVQMQLTWLKMVQSKLSAAMGLQLDKLNKEDIVKEWQLDFDFQEATALALGVCNGSLLAEAVNMVNFATPSTTLNGDESPRQPSFNSAKHRSSSLHSNSSHVQISDTLPRTSGQYNRQQNDNSNERSQLHGATAHNGRDRAISAVASNQGRTSELLTRNTVGIKHSSTSAAHGVSFSRSHDERHSGSAPRLSVDTPSPLIGTLQPEPKHNRPQSSSTFFSAPGEIVVNPRHESTGSSIFSSAMPMTDSPVVDRHSDPPPRAPDVLFTAASVYEFNIDRSRQEAGFPYLTYVTGEIFDVIGERGELWLAKNQDDPQRQVGWIWNKHFAKLAG